MKKLLLSIALLPLIAAASAQPFTSCSLQRNGGTDQFQFAVRGEANIRYYLLEGSRDSVSFDILARSDARAQGTLGGAYRMRSYDTSYRYYRIRQVDLTAGSNYSRCLCIAPAAGPIVPAPAPRPALADSPLLTDAAGKLR